MVFWILAFSYWIHLLATVIWLGGLAILALIALPALRQQTLERNQWVEFQKRLTPWINGSLILLLMTGFVQMTVDEHYKGFLIFDSLWAWALLVKHIIFIALAAVTIYLHWVVQPQMDRVLLLAQQRPKLAAAEQEQLQYREQRLLWTNLVLAVLILLFTAVMTAV